MSQVLINMIFSLSNDIRYVAVYHNNHLESISRSGTTGASSSESDKYEELLVNPALLTLAKQRGNIDCGGMEFLLVRYGNFYQFISSIPQGHISVCIEPHADPLALANPIQHVLDRYFN